MIISVNKKLIHLILKWDESSFAIAFQEASQLTSSWIIKTLKNADLII